MRSLQIDKYSFNVPASWRDLEPAQLAKVADLSDKNLSIHEFRIALLKILMGITVSKKKEFVIHNVTYYYFNHGITHEFLISEIDIAFITSAFDFMFQKTAKDESDDVYTLHYNEVRNLLPAINTPIGLMYGPCDGLSNLLLSEYIHAETAWGNFRKTGKYHFAVRLFAILYRPEAKGTDTSSPNFTGDRREAFNDFLLAERTGALMATERGNVAIVVMWYEACREFINRKWPEVFEGGTQTTEKTDPFTGFMKMVNSLANNDVTQVEKVRQAYLYDVMFTLQSLIVQTREMKESIKTKR
jgi:hypothetical protein